MRQSVKFSSSFIAPSLLVIFASCGSVGHAIGQEPKPTEVKDQIEKSAAAFNQAFSDKNFDALAEMWVIGGEYIDESGLRFSGRESIKNEYKKFFEAYPQLKLTSTVESIRMLNATTAIEEGVTSIEPLPDESTMTGRYTAIHVVQNGKWLLSYVRDRRAQLKSPQSHLEEFNGMVGRWASQHAGVTANLTCGWLAGENYLQRIFEIKRGDQVLSSSTEIVGWDPLRQQIVSWIFSDDGGRSTGVWSSTSEGWLVRLNGVTANGLPTSAIHWWAPLEGGALGWSAAIRRINGQPLTDTRDLVLSPVQKGTDDERSR